MADRVLAANKCWGNQELFDVSKGPKWTHYEYRDKNGNGLIDPDEPVCKSEHTKFTDSDGEKQLKEEGWKELGNAVSFYKKLIAGYSRTSDVKPHELDELFHEFPKKVTSDFPEHFKKERERAEASHRRNAARDLDQFVRKGVLDFIIARVSGNLPFLEPSGWGDFVHKDAVSPSSDVCGQIENVLDMAEKNGVDVSKYRPRLSASLREAKKIIQQRGLDKPETDGVITFRPFLEEFYDSCLYGMTARIDR